MLALFFLDQIGNFLNNPNIKLILQDNMHIATATFTELVI